MPFNRRQESLLVLLTTLLLCVTGCGASAGAMMNEDYSYQATRSSGGAPSKAMEFEEAMDDSDGRLSGESVAATGDAKKSAAPGQDMAPEKATSQVERYIIYSAQMGLYVESVEGAHESIEALAKKHNGWLKTSQNTMLHLRVPAAHFDSLIDELRSMGDVQYVNKTGQDVTEEFFDLQARLANAEAMRKRYIELLAKARNVQESLAIERELGRITEIIERHKGRLKYLRNHVAFSTIVVNLQPKPNELQRPERIALPFHWLRQYKIDHMVR